MAVLVAYRTLEVGLPPLQAVAQCCNDDFEPSTSNSKKEFETGVLEKVWT
jgi:hypothetical protein